MRQYLLGVVACLTSTTLLAATPSLPAFRAGAATSDLTPPLGAAIIGGFLPFPSTNIHDELRARCLVLDDGRTKLALVVLDLLGIGRVSEPRDVGGPRSGANHRASPAHGRADCLGQAAAGQAGPQAGQNRPAVHLRPTHGGHGRQRGVGGGAAASAADRPGVHRHDAQRAVCRRTDQNNRCRPCCATRAPLCPRRRRGCFRRCLRSCDC